MWKYEVLRDVTLNFSDKDVPLKLVKWEVIHSDLLEAFNLDYLLNQGVIRKYEQYPKYRIGEKLAYLDRDWNVEFYGTLSKVWFHPVLDFTYDHCVEKRVRYATPEEVAKYFN